MNPQIERLERQLAEAFEEVEQLEHAIGEVRRACKHVRTPGDINWCQECGALVPSDYETR